MLNASKLSALRAKIKELEKQAKRIESQYAQGVSEAAQIIRQFDLSPADWKRAWTIAHNKARIAETSKERAGRKVPIKYADAKGNKWSGRGRSPLWLVAALKSGKKRDDFLVKRKHATGASIH